jgi:uncharacterized protein (TIGR02271 family)
MNEARRKPIVDQDGLEGFLEIDLYTRQENVLAKFADGKWVTLPLQMLVTRMDGSYYLPLSIADLSLVEEDANALNSSPVRLVSTTDETLEVQRISVPLETVRLSKSVIEEQVMLDQHLLAEQIHIEHVPVNQYLDAPADIRYEGNTVIVPLMEEVLVVQKRLYLREELRITKQQTQKRHAQRHTLRRETLQVEPPPDESELP